MNLPDVQHTTLPSGVRVVTQEMPHLQSAAIGIRIRSGARDEPAGLEGAAHFIEHMLFKGTPTRSSKQITEELDALGAISNAGTDQEDVTYYASSLGTEIPKVFEILADMYLNATFPPEEVEMERKVVMEEIHMYRDNPSGHLYNQFRDGIWSGSPLGHATLGTLETITALTREQLLAFKQERYLAGNTVVTAAGNLGHREVVKLAEQYLGAMLESKPGSHALLPAGWQPALGQARHHERDMAQIQFLLGYRAAGAADPQRPAQSLMCQILGGSMGSRLFQEVREQRGLAYAVSSHEILNHDEGLLAISCGTNPDKAQGAADLCHQILVEMATTPVTDGRLADAKRLAVSRTLQGLDRPERQIMSLADSLEWFGEPRTAAQRIEIIMAQDARKVMEAAQRILAYGPPRLESIGANIEMKAPC